LLKKEKGKADNCCAIEEQFVWRKQVWQRKNIQSDKKTKQNKQTTSVEIIRSRVSPKRGSTDGNQGMQWEVARAGLIKKLLAPLYYSIAENKPRKTYSTLNF
jgi:hypothetical protein